MIARVSATDHDRVSNTRAKLHTLKDRGFKYIVTDEDGDFWVGSDNGLEIEEAISSPFMGQIHLDD